MEPEPENEINLTIVSGDNQLGEPGLPTPEPIVVRVTNSADGAIEGQVVTFTVLTGGGSLSASSVTTAADGRASVNWTLGAEPGPNSVRASAGSARVTFQAVGQVPNT